MKKVHYCRLMGRCIFSIFVLGDYAWHLKGLNAQFVSVKAD